MLYITCVGGLATFEISAVFSTGSPPHSHISIIFTLHSSPPSYICRRLTSLLSIRDQIIPAWLCGCSSGGEGIKWLLKLLLAWLPTPFMLHSYLLFCNAEWWLNNIHYPCHQPRGSIFPVLLVGPGSPRSDGVSFPAYVGDWRPNFHSPTDWYAWGKGESGEQMKWDYEDEDEGICWLNICVNGTLDFSFPISALMICLRLLPSSSALLP